MSTIIWAIIWLVISISGAIFTKSYYRRLINRYRTGPTNNPIHSWALNMDMAGIATIAWIFFAVNSAIVLLLYMLPTTPDVKNSFYSVFHEIFLWLFMGLVLYRIIYNGYYVAYAPIFVTNLTKQPLSIFILGRRIGNAKPGKRIRNNRVLPKYEKYLIEAKTTEGGVVFSKELDNQELDQLDWKVTIS